MLGYHISHDANVYNGGNNFCQAGAAIELSPLNTRQEEMSKKSSSADSTVAEYSHLWAYVTIYDVVYTTYAS